MNTARNLERIADHAAGIAQTIVYLQEGVIIRHKPPGNRRKPDDGRGPGASAFNISRHRLLDVVTVQPSVETRCSAIIPR